MTDRVDLDEGTRLWEAWRQSKLEDRFETGNAWNDWSDNHFAALRDELMHLRRDIEDCRAAGAAYKRQRDLALNRRIARPRPGRTPRMTPPSGIDWQQRISRALGVKLGQQTYPLDDAAQRIEELRAAVTKVRATSARFHALKEPPGGIFASAFAAEFDKALEGLPE